MHNYTELVVWQKAKALAVELYALTDDFPKHEVFGLTQQIRRAVVSIPSNIAEGAGRSTNLDFCRFLDIANGSSFEIETQLLIASELGYVKKEKLADIMLKIKEVQKSIFNLRKSFSKSG